jgi:hypothetical protein
MPIVWSSYSPKEAAQLIGLPEAVVRGLARAGVIGDGAVPPKLGFRDLAALRAVAAVIAAGVPAARAQREVIALVARQPGLRLPDLSIEASDGHVRIKGEPASAVVPQLSLSLAPAKEREEGAVHAMPVRPELPAPTPVAAFTADEWFERALELEDSNVEAAIDAYKRSLKLRPDSTEAWVNLGRRTPRAATRRPRPSASRRRWSSIPTTRPACTTSASSRRTAGASRRRSGCTRARSSSTPSWRRRTTTWRRSSTRAAIRSSRSGTSTSTAS